MSQKFTFVNKFQGEENMPTKKKRGPKAKPGPKPKKKAVGRPAKAKQVVVSDEVALQLGAEALSVDEKKLLKIADKLGKGEPVKGFCLAPRAKVAGNRFLEGLIDYVDSRDREWKLCINKADQ